jgi:hypothetical protein
MNNHAEEILENVVWLVNQYDDDALAKRQDLPFLELAKYVSPRLPPGASNQKGREQFTYLMKRDAI